MEDFAHVQPLRSRKVRCSGMASAAESLDSIAAGPSVRSLQEPAAFEHRRHLLDYAGPSWARTPPDHRLRRLDNNDRRPHSSLGYLTPVEYAEQPQDRFVKVDASSSSELSR